MQYAVFVAQVRNCTDGGGQQPSNRSITSFACTLFGQRTWPIRLQDCRSEPHPRRHMILVIVPAVCPHSQYCCPFTSRSCPLAESKLRRCCSCASVQRWTAANASIWRWILLAIYLGRLPIAFSSGIAALRRSSSALPSSGRSHCHGLAAYSSALSCVNSARPALATQIPASRGLSCAAFAVSASTGQNCPKRAAAWGATRATITHVLRNVASAASPAESMRGLHPLNASTSHIRWFAWSFSLVPNTIAGACRVLSSSSIDARPRNSLRCTTTQSPPPCPATSMPSASASGNWTHLGMHGSGEPCLELFQPS